MKYRSVICVLKSRICSSEYFYLQSVCELSKIQVGDLLGTEVMHILQYTQNYNYGECIILYNVGQVVFALDGLKLFSRNVTRVTFSIHS